MLQTQIGSGLRTYRCRFLSLVRNPAPRWFPVLALTLLGGIGAATTARAQAPPAGATSGPTAAAQPAATSVTPLPRFVPRDNLIFYVDFDGLDAHTEGWRKTAAYKMLNQTPLGVMLEEVAAQLLDKALESVPNRKLSGTEIVTLVKLMARKGWVLALNANLTGPNPFVGTLVLRGAASKDKEIKSITSRLIGTLMGPDPKPRIDRKAGRVLVVVPRGAAADAGWVWWPEKDDLIIGFLQPSNADAIIAAIDGKTPSAADHAILKEMARPDGSFDPLMTAILDPSAAPADPKTGMTEFFAKLKSTTGLSRIDYRWGFDGDALMSVSRLFAPAPRKSALALFDQPPLDTKNLIPMPEGVESFAMMSVSPVKVLEAVRQIGPAGEVKEKIDDLVEKVHAQSRIDFEKDFLSNLGPRMAIYLSPGRSAATTDEAPQTPVGLAGLDPMAMLSSLQGALPKPTLVAELRDPVAFGKALDSIMLAVNKELKAQAMEKAAEEGAADGAGKAPGPGQAQAPTFGRGPGRGPGGAEGPGGRPGRRRSLKDTPAPEFRLMPGTVKIYMLTIPTDSPLKIVPPGVRPTIRLEGNHIAFSSTSEAARTALEAVKKKGWKPGPDVEQALSHAPAGPIFLAVGDPRETGPSLLASLPGTLQAQINSVIALSAGGAAGARPGGTAGAGQPGAGAGFGPGGGVSGDPRGRKSLGGPGMSGGPGFSGASAMPGGPAPNTSAAAGVSPDAMIQLKVDAAKLPKAEELKALMFPGTLAVVVDDTSIRLVSRESFPDVVSGLGIGAAFAGGIVPAINAARARAQAAAGVPPGQAAPGTPPAVAQPPAAGGESLRPGGPRGPGRPGRSGGRGPG